MTTSLAEVIEQRNDVISVHVFKTPNQLPSKLQETLNENDIVKLPLWIQKTINWQYEGKISETELVNAINYLLYIKVELKNFYKIRKIELVAVSTTTGIMTFMSLLFLHIHLSDPIGEKKLIPHDTHFIFDIMKSVFGSI